MNHHIIYTITLNLGLDIGGTVAQLIPNEKNYEFNETRCAGGNGINTGCPAFYKKWVWHVRRYG